MKKLNLRAGNRRKSKSRLLACESLESRQLLAVVTTLTDNVAGSLRSTIASAPAGDTITFQAGLTGTITLTAGELVVNKALTIDGDNRITVDANDLSRVMRIEDATPATFADVTLKNIILQNGRSVTDGGGIQSFENLTLDNVTVRDNEVTGAVGNTGQDAGGIAQGGETKAGGNLIIMNSLIENNTAIDDGGALDHYNSNDLTIINTIIRSNVSGDLFGTPGDADQAGYVGAIRVIDAVTVALYGDQNILFDGLMFEDNSTVVVSDNASPAALGGILVSAPPNSNWGMTVRDSTFSGNFHKVTDSDPNDAYYADGRGGALYVTDVTNLTIEDSTFTNNYSYGVASGLQVANSDVNVVATLNNLTFDSNGDGAPFGFAGRSQEAGAMWIINFNSGVTTLDMTINDSTFTNNTATFGGALLLRQGVNVTVNDSKLTGNTSNRGGAIYSLGTGASVANSLTVNRSVIDNNTAVYGGGGIQAASGGAYLEVVNINDSTISRNVTTAASATPDRVGGVGFGGGINADNTDLSIVQSTISSNSAFEGGGGVFAGYYATAVDIQRSTITLNTATNSSAFANSGGGGLLIDSPYTLGIHTIDNTIVSGNTAGSNVDIGGYDSTVQVNAGSSWIGVGATNITLNNSGGSQINAGSANLGPLQYNGGPRTMLETHEPSSTSGVVNAGSGTRTLDQRGLAGVFGAAVDMGSVERQPTTQDVDYNNDGLWDCADMDILEAAIDAGTDLSFDVNQDGVLNSQDILDRTAPGFGWLVVAGEQRFGAGRSFKDGDANLDGTVDGQDFIIWNSNKFTPARRWCLADFNQDNTVDGQDFIVWNSNKFTSSDAGRPGNSTAPLFPTDTARQASKTAVGIRSLETAEVVKARVPQAAPAAISVVAVGAGSDSAKKLEDKPQVETQRQQAVLTTPVSSIESNSDTRSHRARREASAVDQVFANLDLQNVL